MAEGVSEALPLQGTGEMSSITVQIEAGVQTVRVVLE